MDGLMHMIRGDLSDTSASADKLKRDFAVLVFGDHYSLVLRKDVLGKEEVDGSTVPRYCCYEDMFDAISKCHIDQEGHSGIHKTESSVRHHYVNISRTMVEKFIASCSCQLDRRHPGQTR